MYLLKDKPITPEMLGHCLESCSLYMMYAFPTLKLVCYRDVNAVEMTTATNVERKRQDMNNRLNKIYEEIYDIDDMITDSEKKKEAAQ